ncbi:MAG: replication-relaxation family protein [Rhizobiales bacterium]|nr:replication-relaxation family protein [Hyphomicrobiales bacterium]NRB15088.1 replication-relaxation family protein [Hyphomicrobiales bacterium]
MVDNDFDAIQRRSRTRPTTTNKRVTAQPRDILWFEKIHQHGPLSTSFLHGFSKHNHHSEKSTNQRLTDLFNEDNTPQHGTFLQRPHQQLRTIDSRYNELVYDLTPASISMLKKAELWKKQSTKRSGPWLHNYMVSCITASIELATSEREEITFIPQSKILARANTELKYSTQFVEPNNGKTITKDIIPDALFGLEYKHSGKSYFRFFLVEADRGTEPSTTKNFNRKSHLRNLLQYEDYIGNGRYKNHLNLTAPLLVLNVFSDRIKLKKMIDLIETASSSRGNPYMLFQYFEEFDESFKPPKPNFSLLNSGWQRAGKSDFNIGEI